MRARTAIPPTNHARSAAPTPDPHSFTRRLHHRQSPARAPGGHPDGTGLAALRWNAKRGHRHAAPAAAPAASRCRFPAVRAVARPPARTGRASRRAAGPGRTRHDPRPDTRSDRARGTGHAADRRSAAAANADAPSRRPTRASAAMLMRSSTLTYYCAPDATKPALQRTVAPLRCSALLYLLQSRRIFYRQFTVSPPRL